MIATSLYDQLEPRYETEVLAWIPLPKSNRTRCVGILLVRCNGKTGFLFARHVSRRTGMKLSYFESQQTAAKEQEPLEYILDAFKAWLNEIPRRPGFEAVPVGLERLPEGNLLTVACPFCGENHSHSCWPRANKPAGTRVSHCDLWGVRSGREYTLPSQPLGNFVQNSKKRWAILRAEGVFRMTLLTERAAEHLAQKDGFNLDLLARCEPFRTLGLEADDISEASTDQSSREWGLQWVFSN